MHFGRALSVLSLASLASLGAAQSEMLQNKYHHRQVCAGIYSADDLSGPFDSEVTVSFPGSEGGSIAVAIFAYSDIDSLGLPVKLSNGQEGKKYLCDDEAISAGLCTESQLGTILMDKYVSPPKQQVIGEKVTIPADPISYAVNETGYYCVATFPLSDEEASYKVQVHFMNAYGHLPGEEQPLLWFPAILFFIYLAFFIVWLVGFLRFRKDALAVQKWITALAAYMTVEQVVLWIYYNYFNANGEAAALTKFLLALVALLGAGRLSLTLFCVLIVSLGYSVVHERLGPVMKWCKIMAVALFASSALYLIDTYYVVPTDETRIVEFLFFFPSAVLVGIFYVWTLQALGDTRTYLMARKQHIKARMYRNLWWVLLGSAVAIFGFFIIHTVSAATMRVKDIVNTYWKTKWMLSDGWPNVVYMLAFFLVAFIWRPTGENRRFAMSSQLSQSEDAEEFEIGSLNGSDDEEDVAPTSTSGIHREEPVMYEQRQSAESVRSDGSDGVRNDSWNRREDEDELVEARGGRL